MTASGCLVCCRSNVTHAPTWATATALSLTSRNALLSKHPAGMPRSCTILNPPDNSGWTQTRGYSASCAPSLAHHEALDVSLVHPKSFETLLETHGLTIQHDADLLPEQFLPQAVHPMVVAIFAHPTSAPIHVVHRRIGARTQSRATLAPGDCLLRGDAARHDWTLAIPPLLGAAAGLEQFRRVAFLMSAETDTTAKKQLEFKTHRPRSVRVL